MFIQLKKFQDDLRELVFQCTDELMQMDIDKKTVLRLQRTYLLGKMSEITTMIDNAPDILLQKAGD